MCSVLQDARVVRRAHIRWVPQGDAEALREGCGGNGQGVPAPGRTGQEAATGEQKHQNHIPSEGIPVPQRGRGMLAPGKTDTTRLRILSNVCRHVQCHHHVLPNREIQAGHTQICPQKGSATLHEFLIGAIDAVFYVWPAVFPKAALIFARTAS